jgi:aminocarboxymuconate-semialdehyde decarboxylase
MRNVVGLPFGMMIAGASLAFGECWNDFRGSPSAFVTRSLSSGRLVQPGTYPQRPSSGSRAVSDSLNHLHYDSITHSSRVLAFLIGSVGVDRVLLGSDYPFDRAISIASRASRR